MNASTGKTPSGPGRAARTPAWRRGGGLRHLAMTALLLIGPPGPEVLGGRSPRPSRVPAAANEEGDGIVVGAGPLTVDIYIDFLCPFCRLFEQTTGPVLERLMAQDLVETVYHPMGFLDELSTTRYSSRASAASGCASDAGGFVEYAHALFAAQPPEGGPGLSDDELIALGEQTGLREPDFAQCVRSATYLDWATYVTERALERGIAATPTVLVQGLPVPANPRPILAAVAALTA
jgi:protein-disulfide isomerase